MSIPLYTGHRTMDTAHLLYDKCKKLKKSDMLYVFSVVLIDVSVHTMKIMYISRYGQAHLHSLLLLQTFVSLLSSENYL